MDAADNSAEGAPFFLLEVTCLGQLWPLFVLLLVMHMVKILGNVLIVQASSALHVPVHFLLAHLSIDNLCFTSVIVPRMLANLLAYGHCISLLTQTHYFG